MRYFLQSFNEYTGVGIINILLLALTLFAWLILLIICQIIIHEGGHCIFGHLTGFRLVSFRVLSYTIIKENGRLKIKRYSLPGSLGQCLMHPTRHKEKTHLVPYFLGGITADSLVGAFSVWLTLGPLEIPFIIRCGFMVTAFYFLGSILLNGLPIVIGTAGSDGYNVLACIKDRQAKMSAYDQLYVLSLLQKGYTYGSLAKETVMVPEGADLTNPLIIGHKLIECYHYMDLRKWDKALTCISKAEKALGKNNQKGLGKVLTTEELFIYIKAEKEVSDIEGLYNRVKKVLVKSTGDFQLTRVRMAYDLYKDSSAKNSDRIKKELLKIKASYPYKGDAYFCTGLIMEML